MRKFEKANPKSNAVWKGKITGTFLYYKYYEDNPQEKKAKKKPSKKPKKVEEIEVEEEEEFEYDEEELEDLEEEEIDEEELEEALEDEENLLKDCIADYKSEYDIKGKVNINTKKFKKYFEQWNQTE